MTDAVDTDRSASDCELAHSDVDNNKCSNSSQENELISDDGKHDLPCYFSSVCDALTSCDQNNAVWINSCSSELSLPSSLYGVQETSIQESCSFASLFFVSGNEMDGSDFCSTDGDESDCSGFLSPTSACIADDDVLADALLSGLSCIPFADNWVMGCFSDCTPTGFDSELELYLSEDDRYVPCDYEACKYPLGVREANVRWNEAYSFPADILFETSQHNTRMV